MRALDQRLLCPSSQQLAEALRAAVAFANERVRGRFLPWPPPDLDDALDAWAAQPTGKWLWSGYQESIAGTGHAWPEAGFAWWSDRLGRKHVRIPATRRQHFSSVGELFPESWEDSPLAYLAPSSVARVECHGQRRIYVFCSCGEHGSPEALGWMGDRCGPCHDRGEEGSLPEPAWPLSLAGSGSLAALLFAPAGELILIRGKRVGLWDLDSRRALWEDDCPPLAWMARPVLSPDGRWLAFPARDHVVVWELATGRRCDVASQPYLRGNEYLSAVLFTPDSSRLALLSFRHLTIWSVGEHDLSHERTLETGVEEARSLLSSPNGRHLLVGSRSGLIRRWSLTTWRRSSWSLRSPSGVTFMAHRGRTLLAADGHQAQIQLYNLDTEKFVANVEASCRLAITPDGRAFVSLCDGLLVSDFASGRPLARMWFPQCLSTSGFPRALAISPDGRTLAVAREGSESISLYPMSLFGLAEEQ
jgi:WD40 repeat protein